LEQINFVYETFDDITWKKTTFELGASSEELVGVGSDTGDEEQCSGDCY
jgi:hypothetical protein